MAVYLVLLISFTTSVLSRVLCFLNNFCLGVWAMLCFKHSKLLPCGVGYFMFIAL